MYDPDSSGDDPEFWLIDDEIEDANEDVDDEGEEDKLPKDF